MLDPLFRRLGISALAGVALAYYWRGHGPLAAVGSFLLGGFVASSAMNAMNVLSPPAAQSSPTSAPSFPG